LILSKTSGKVKKTARVKMKEKVHENDGNDGFFVLFSGIAKAEILVA